MKDFLAHSRGEDWSAMDATGIAEALAHALLKDLDLDLVYVQLADPVDNARLEVGLSKHCDDALSVDKVKIAVAPLVGAASAIPLTTTLSDPFCNRCLRATVVPIPPSASNAILIAASQRTDFPTDQDRRWLCNAAGQAATALQRHQTERALKASQEYLRAVLDSAGDGIYVMGVDTRCTYLNPIGAAMLGYQAEELVGRPLHDIIHHTHVDGRAHPVAECPIFLAFSQGLPSRVDDDVFWRKDGSPVPVTYSVSPIMVDGRSSGAVVTYRDISERKQAEAEQGRSKEHMAALLAAEKRHSVLLRQIAETSRTMGVVLSLDSIARILTEEARAMLGAHQAVTSLSVSEDWSQAINAVSLSEKYAAFRSYSPKPDGTGIYSEVCRTNRPMRLTQQELEAHPAWKGFGKHAKEHPLMRGWLAVPLVGHGGKNLGLVQLSDKYEGNFTEEDEAILVQLASIAATGIENARLYEHVREQDRRKDEFLATLAHELRNPLAPIRTGLTLLATAQSTETIAKTREIMERQVSHMVHLIDDLLDVSRITSGKVQLKKERVDVRAILESALELSRPLIEENRHQLYISMFKEPLVLDADPTRMAQIVSNLLNNAAKYTPHGGRIDVSAEREGTDVVIRVRDNGVGLTVEALPQVFELFSQVGKTLERSQGGLGIGLALVKRLVEMHAGQVTAHSEGPGQGCTFLVRLPLARANNADGEHGLDCPDISASFTPRRILVVDDNIDAAQLLSMLLGFDGHVVETVHTGPDAVQAARRVRPDVIFLDIGLPGMNGYEVAHQLRRDPSMNGMTLVALTGWGTEDDRRRTQGAGFDKHLTKPVQTSELQAIIHGLTARQ